MAFRTQADAAAQEMVHGVALGVEEKESPRPKHDFMITTLRAKVRRFMLEELRENGFHESIGDEDSLLESQILDSLSILKLISFADEEFGVYFGGDELEPERFETVNRIAELLREKLAAKQ